MLHVLTEYSAARFAHQMCAASGCGRWSMTLPLSDLRCENRILSQRTSCSHGAFGKMRVCFLCRELDTQASERTNITPSNLAGTVMKGMS